MNSIEEKRIQSGLERRLSAVEALIPTAPAWRTPSNADHSRAATVRLGPTLRGKRTVSGIARGRHVWVLVAAAALFALVAGAILVAGLRLQRSPDLSTGPFGPTGLLRGSDSAASATLLPDGRVLIVNGTWRGIGIAVPTAEIWDPSTGMSHAIAPPIHPRVNPTVTLLLDGRVLVVGGFGGPYAYSSTAVATAEVWDPETETFTPTGSMAKARVGHSATLLADGRVLVAGGGGVEDDGKAVEIWDPATGRFSESGQLTPGRTGHSATLLLDGRVLVSGGYGSDGESLGNYQRWDPATSGFEGGGQFLDRPASATLTRLLDGRLLLVGGIRRGYGPAGEGPYGDGNADTLPWAFLRSPDLHGIDIADLSVPRFGHAAVLLPDGRVLILGGMTDEDGTATASVEVFDPATVSFNSASPLPRPIANPTAMLLTDGRVLIIGDPGSTGGSPTVDVYDPGGV
jgi:hypothetical protein